MRLPDLAHGFLSWIVVKRRDPQDQIRLAGTLRNEMRAAIAAEIAALAGRGFVALQAFLSLAPDEVFAIDRGRAVEG